MHIDPRLADRVRRHVADPVETVVPRQAATVALLRDGAEGPEVLLMERPTSMAFAAAMTVFPGGVVDATDEADATTLDCPAVEVAALRETFEEVGIWLAAQPDADLADDTVRWQADLASHRRGLADVLGEAGAAIRPGALLPWSRWVTPAWSDRRYDTHFFLARCPEGHQVRADPGETVRPVWLTPAAALREEADGRRRMMTPTVRTLADLAAWGDDVHRAWQQERTVPSHTFQAERDGDRIRVDIVSGGRREEAWSIPFHPGDG